MHITWSGTARLFFEIVPADGSDPKQIMLATESEADEDNNISIKGESDEVKFGDGDKIYLCVAQHSGNATFDNM